MTRPYWQRARKSRWRRLAAVLCALLGLRSRARQSKRMRLGVGVFLAAALVGIPQDKQLCRTPEAIEAYLRSLHFTPQPAARLYRDDRDLERIGFIQEWRWHELSAWVRGNGDRACIVAQERP